MLGSRARMKNFKMLHAWQSGSTCPAVRLNKVKRNKTASNLNLYPRMIEENYRKVKKHENILEKIKKLVLKKM